MYARNHWFYRLLSTVLSLVLLLQMLPAQALAIETISSDSPAESAAGEVYIVEEATQNRTEFSKEFKLNNGLHLAAVYAEPVHYEENGQWKEIDNTLKPSGTEANASYINTAGVWEVSFPQQLTADHSISVTKDGYTLSFQMHSQLRLPIGSGPIHTGDYDMFPLQPASAQLMQIDYSESQAQAQHPETVYTKGHSRLQYNEVYAGTDVIYDLHGNQLKESIVMEAYDAFLGGYSFILDTEGMLPVLGEDGRILLYDQTQTEVVMVMPAPYLMDAAGAYNYEVEVVLAPKGDSYILLYGLPQEWLASADRQWPVILDPVVQADLDINNVCDATVSSIYQESYTDGSIECGYNSGTGISRIFLMYQNLPALTSSDVILDARVTLYKAMTSTSQRLVTIHKLHNTWTSNTVTWSNYFGSDPGSNHDAKVVDYLYVQNEGFYSWDITDIVRDWYEGENTGMLFRYGDETAEGMIAQFYSSDFSAWPTVMPALTIYFRNNNGLESYWDYTTATAGRAGTGYVNNYTGNLVWVRSDIGFGGNRMPVSISHVYNANDAANNIFGMGYGWRTNFNQRVYQWSVDGSYYVWEDSDGTSHYFLYDETNNHYKDEDGLELTLTTSGSGTTKYCISDKYGNCTYFDTLGRLIKQENNQKEKSSINITYTDSSGYLISTVTDGAGRVYAFTYSGGLLSRIAYNSKGTTPLTYVDFGYSNGHLTSITDKDAKSSTYTYYDNHLLKTAKDVDNYTLTYTYTNVATGKPARVESVNETHNGSDGGSLTIEYAHNQTTFTDVSGNKQILQFNNYGNTISIQDGLGRAQYARYATDTNSSGKGNQLTLASKLQNTVSNLISNSSFESDGVPTDSSGARYGPTDAKAYHGSRSFYITRATAGYTVAPHSYITVENGETVTFSGYVNAEEAAARIGLFNGSSYVIISEALPAGTGWTRMEVSYTNTTGAPVSIRGVLSLYTGGTAYIDCIQMEKMPTASRYNLIENGDFRDSSAWSSSTGIVSFNGAAAAPQLSSNVYQMTGNPATQNRVSQTVKVSGAEGDTFVVAGWAKGDSAPLRDDRRFSIIATFLDGSGNPLVDEDGEPMKNSVVTLDFNPDTNSEISWQYLSSAMVAPAAFGAIKIELAYDYNVNTVYFDGIQLYKEQFGQSYTYDENGNLIAVKDIQGQETTYDYNEAGTDLIKQTLPNGAKLYYTYDAYHNVETATSGTGVAYVFYYDKWGNNTEVRADYAVGFNPDNVEVKDDGTVDPPDISLISIHTSASYSDDGNRLVSNTDAVGNTTYYGYNADTNVLEWVQYPNDSDATRTNYTYDELYRMATSTVTTNTGSALTATYTYTNDLLTAVETDSTRYDFNYGNFGLRSNIKIGSRTLASYSYTSRTNYLASLDYGNGDVVNYIYDQLGRMTKQSWGTNDYVDYRYDNNGALASTYDHAAGRTTTYYYDFTDRLMKYAVTGSSYKHSVEYQYDATNKLLALVEKVNDTTLTTSYTYDKDNRVTSVTVGDVTETYTYDNYGRLKEKVTAESGNTVLIESYTYRDNPNDGHPSTQVASVVGKKQNNTVIYSYTYTYDGNGNIATVNDGTHTTTYTYDSANQLIREDNAAAGKTWRWEYDNAGNITHWYEYAYTTGTVGAVLADIAYGYGDNSWGDLLTAYGSQSITHDNAGNPLDDSVWTYTWDRGRQLQKMSRKDNSAEWTFTYDAEGMRIGRTNGTTTYGYTYNGSQLTQMTVGSDTLTFTYDANGAPLTVTYGGTTYYYVTNLQGDVIAILNSAGTKVVFYTYDAWGNILNSDEVATTTLGTLNPLRYRSYVYDHETGLYYLQSRYYNPKVGRFINADALVATGQGVLGNNMFAYCVNNPVISSDVSGAASKVCLSDSTEPRLPWKDSGSGGGIPRRDYRGRGDYIAYILASEGIFYYGGAWIIHTDLFGLKGGGFSYGGIILIDDYYTNDPETMGRNVLRHEYGHYIHMKQIGIGSYTTKVAIPSLIGAAISDRHGTPFQQYVYDNYHSQPWERIANELGGATANYLNGSDVLAVLYWLYTML